MLNNRIKLGDGSVRWGDQAWAASSLEDDGNPGSGEGAGVLMDITERKLAEQGTSGERGAFFATWPILRPFMILDVRHQQTLYIFLTRPGWSFVGRTNRAGTWKWVGPRTCIRNDLQKLPGKRTSKHSTTGGHS